MYLRFLRPISRDEKKIAMFFKSSNVSLLCLRTNQFPDMLTQIEKKMLHMHLPSKLRISFYV